MSKLIGDASEADLLGYLVENVVAVVEGVEGESPTHPSVVGRAVRVGNAFAELRRRGFPVGVAEGLWLAGRKNFGRKWAAEGDQFRMFLRDNDVDLENLITLAWFYCAWRELEQGVMVEGWSELLPDSGMFFEWKMANRE